jgi:hypothetical protein
MKTEAAIVYDETGARSEALAYVEEATIVEVDADVPIVSREGYEAACELARMVKARWSEIDEVRKSITAPMMNAQRNTNAFFRPALDKYASIEARLKKTIAAYVVEQERVKVAAMQALAAGVDVHGSSLMARPEATGVGVRMVKKWRIVDADRVARQFCSPDPAKIDAFLADGGIEAIPGIEFYEEASVRVTRAK